MSCFGEGLGDWICAEDDTLHVSRLDTEPKGPMASLLAALDYYPDGFEDDEFMTADESHFESGSEASSIIEDERTGPKEGEHLHREELALEIETPEKTNLLRSPEFIPHIDQKHKAESRAKELDELRRRNLTKSQAVKLDNADAPTNVDTFHKRQKEFIEAQRKNQLLAKDMLHSYRADEKQMMEEIRRNSPKGCDGQRGVPSALSAPAYFTISEIDEFQRIQKDVATWRSERVKSFGDVAIPECKTVDTLVLGDEYRVNIRKIQTCFDGRESIETALRSPLPDSPHREDDPPSDLGIISESSAGTKTNSLMDPEGSIYGKTMKNLQRDDAAVATLQASEETEENSDIESTDSIERKVSNEAQPCEVEEDGTMESEELNKTSTLLGEDSIRSLSKSVRPIDPPEEDIRSTSERHPLITETENDVPYDRNASVAILAIPGKSLIPRGVSASTSKIPSSNRSLLAPPKTQTPTTLLAASRRGQASMLKAGSPLRGARKSLFEEDKTVSGDSPSSPSSTFEPTDSLRDAFLKRVPLYSRRPTIQREKVAGTVCPNKYIPNLHKCREACERCLYWASPEEKEKFQARGRHLRIMMVRGGCGRACTIFPRNKDEFPVRLCKKCYFDTHRNDSSKEEEDKLLWS